MSTLELKEKIIDYIEYADEKVLEAIYTLLEANVDNRYTITDEQMRIVEERREEYLSGKTKTHTWEEAQKIIRGKA